MRQQIDLSGYWQGRLVLNPDIDVAAPDVIERLFYVPLPWTKQIEDLQWPGSASRELSGVVQGVQNQNFRDQTRKYTEGVITYSREVFLAETPDPAPNRIFLVCLHAQIPDKPLLVTEFGGEGILGQRSLLMNHYEA